MRAFIHSFDPPEGGLGEWVSVPTCLTDTRGVVRLCTCADVRLYQCVFPASRAREAPGSMCTQLPPAIFSDWAWPGFLLPCFLLCIPNYGGEFLGRATRIARFGLISSLNRDISRLQPSDQRRAATTARLALTRHVDRERDSFIPFFMFHP